LCSDQVTNSGCLDSLAGYDPPYYGSGYYLSISDCCQEDLCGNCDDIYACCITPSVGSPYCVEINCYECYLASGVWHPDFFCGGVNQISCTIGGE
jgi:hypothetical protein